MAALALVFHFTIFSSSADVPKVDMTWSCGSGFPPCSTDTMGVCSPQPYLKMSSNQYNLTFTAPKAANYTCTITATASYFDYVSTPQTSEKIDIYLNNKKVGTTNDVWCPPGGFIGGTPCSSQCLANGCQTVIANGEYTCDCDNVCTNCCSSCGDCAPNVLIGSTKAFSGKEICFKIKNSLFSVTEDKRVVFGASDTATREYIQIRYRNAGGLNNLELRSGFCFACACTNWCGMERTTNRDNWPDAKADSTYKISISADGHEVTFSEVGGKTMYSWSTASVKAVYPSGLSPNRYCISGDGCSWNGHNYAFAPANTVEIVSCGGGGTEKLCGQECTPGVDTCQTGTCTSVSGTYKCYNCCGDGACQTALGEDAYSCLEDCGGGEDYCDDMNPYDNCKTNCQCPPNTVCQYSSGMCMPIY